MRKIFVATFTPGGDFNLLASYTEHPCQIFEEMRVGFALQGRGGKADL